MSEVKDPKIKLFGKTIELPENSAAVGDDGGELCSARSCEPAVRVSSSRDPPSSSDSMVEDSIYLSSGDAEEQEPEPVKTPSTHEKNNTKEDDESVSGLLKLDEPRDPTARTDPNNTAARNMASKLPETGGGSTEKPVPNHPPARKTAPEHEQQLPEPGGSNEKAPKKPDKILPCPRCNSTDTKFCYFNNYNVNQPRHFCKNCQRYWTAGGTMRNVPVGAGRRKNKSSSAAAAFHHNCPSSPPNGGTVIAFGGPVSTDHTGRPGPKNEPIRPELESRVQPPPGPPVQVPCYPGQTQWAYHPWNSVAWGPFYPATLPPYWGWSVPPYVVPTVGPGSWPSPPMLGKHSREEAAESDPNKQCLWVPKTLRIDDPREAAKSSIWATLGIANETGAEPGKGCLFGAFGAKGDSESHLSEASTVLQANPAAMSRAVSFHESS